MNDQGQLDQLVELLKEVGRAHHQAFFDVDGYDPEWPEWYAAYIQERLSALLGRDLTIDEIAAAMRAAEQAQPEGVFWPVFYAQFFLESFA